MLDLQPPLPWVTWQDLRTESKTNPESMLSLMLETKVQPDCRGLIRKHLLSAGCRCQTTHLTRRTFLQEFALCSKWVELYPVSDQLRLQLRTEHLLHLLEKGQTDEAFQVYLPTSGLHSQSSPFDWQ